MSKKMMSPNTTIWWVPLAGLTTPSVPKATEITAGTNISGAIETGYKLNATDADTDKSATIIDESNVETPTIGNYEADLTFFRDDIGTGTNAAPSPATIFTTAFNLFKGGPVQGWLVKRLGSKSTVAAAASQQVSVFKVEADYYRTLDGDKGTPVRFQVPFLPLGEYYLNVTTQA
jgi:hypothetical protein